MDVDIYTKRIYHKYIYIYEIISKGPWNKYFCICLNLDIVSNIPERWLKLQKIYDIITFEKGWKRSKLHLQKWPSIPTALTLSQYHLNSNLVIHQHNPEQPALFFVYFLSFKLVCNSSFLSPIVTAFFN